MQRSSSLPVPARSGAQLLAGARASAPRILPYLLPAVAALLATGTWFRPGTFVSTGDVAPFVRSNLAAEWGSVWGHSLSGAGSVSFQPVARTPELLALWLARITGAGAPDAQRWFYGALAVAAVTAAVWFVAGFVDHPGARGAAGVVAFFNPFVLQSLPNPLPLWSIAVMGTMGGLVVRAGRGRHVRPVLLAAASVPTVYLAVNPPLLAMTAVWLVMVSVVMIGTEGYGAGRRVGLLLLRATPWAVAFNLWWLAPFVATLRSQGTGFVVQAQTNVLSWSWTQARASLANAASLATHWGWSYPEYFPYAQAIDGSVWSPLRFGLPALSFASPILAKPYRRRTALILTVCAIALVFLAKGLNPPLASINLFLYRHVPGMWLLREPMSKLGPVLILCYAVMFAISIEGVRDFVTHATGFTRPAVAVIVGVLAIGSVGYAYPLWTGRVIPDARPVLPPAHVRVPQAWLRVAANLNADPSGGKILVLPLDDFYQMPTTWGYYGVDQIPRSLLTRPTIQPLPDSYYGELPPVGATIGAVQSALLDGDPAAVLPLLRALGVSDVVVRKDLQTDFPKRSIVDAAQLLRGVHDTAGLTRTLSSSVADVYHVATSVPAAAEPVSDAQVPDSLLPSLLASLRPGQVLVDRGGTSRSLVIGPGNPRGTFDSNGHDVRIVGHAFGPQMVSAREEGRSLQLAAAATLRLDGRPVGRGTIGSVRLPRGADVAAVATSLGMAPLRSGQGLIPIGNDPRLEVLGASGAAAPLRFSGVHDCNTYDARGPRQTQLSATPIPGGVALAAASHSACVRTDVRPVTGAPVLIRLEYRTFSGRPARLCLWQVGPERCAATAPLDPTPGWHRYATVVRPAPGTRAMQLYLYADGDARGGGLTRAGYRRVDVVGLRVIKTTRIPMPLLTIHALSVPAGSHSLRLATAGDARLAPLPYAVRDCHAYDARTIASAGLAATPLGSPGDGVRLQASAHAACVSAPVQGFVPGQTYELRLQARSVAGLPPRICVWEEGPDRCAPAPSMPSTGSGWQDHTVTITPDHGTTGISVYLYADAVRTAATGPTITEYRHLSLVPTPSLAVSVLPVPASSAPATVWHRTGPSSFEASVPQSTRPFTLTIPESAAPGWRLDGVPAGRSVGPTVVDGYAQGWVIEPGAAFHATVAFGPNLPLVTGARGLSAAAVLGACWLAFVRRRRRAARPPQTPAPDPQPDVPEPA